MKHSTPTKEGFYWGQWRIKADDTHICPKCNQRMTNDGPFDGVGDEWEVMHVVENSLDEEDPEHLMVMVPGVEAWQPLENFFWGPRVIGHKL